MTPRQREAIERRFEWISRDLIEDPKGLDRLSKVDASLFIEYLNQVRMKIRNQDRRLDGYSSPLGNQYLIFTIRETLPGRISHIQYAGAFRVLAKECDEIYGFYVAMNEHQRGYEIAYSLPLAVWPDGSKVQRRWFVEKELPSDAQDKEWRIIARELLMAQYRVYDSLPIMRAWNSPERKNPTTGKPMTLEDYRIEMDALTLVVHDNEQMPD